MVRADPMGGKGVRKTPSANRGEVTQGDTRCIDCSNRVLTDHIITAEIYIKKGIEIANYPKMHYSTISRRINETL